MGWQGVRLKLQIGGFIKSVLCYNLCPLLTGKSGMSAFSWAPPHRKSPQIPSSQLGTREVKIRKQIGLLANLSWEWLAREGEGRRTEERKCLDIDRRKELKEEKFKEVVRAKEEEETNVRSERNEKMDKGKYWHSRKKRRCMFTWACMCIFVFPVYKRLHLCAHPHVPPVCWVMYHQQLYLHVICFCATSYCTQLHGQTQMLQVEWKNRAECDIRAVPRSPRGKTRLELEIYTRTHAHQHNMYYIHEPLPFPKAISGLISVQSECVHQKAS